MGRPIVLLNQYNLQYPLKKGVVYHITDNLRVEKDETFRISKGFVYVMSGARLEVEGCVLVDGGKLTIEGTMNVRTKKMILREPGILTCLSSGKIVADGEIEIERGKCFMSGALYMQNKLLLRSGMIICNPTGIVIVNRGVFEVSKSGFFIMNGAIYTQNSGIIRLHKVLEEVGINAEADDKTIIFHNTSESNLFLADFAIAFPENSNTQHYRLISNSCWC